MSETAEAVPEVDEALEGAAARVRKAAAKFGKTQALAAELWVEKAISLDPEARRDAESLMSQQLTLFEECLLDDEGGKCKELDSALTDLEDAMAKSGAPKKKQSPTLIFVQSRTDRAAARVQSAASKFGAEQKKGATEWIKAVKTGDEKVDSQQLLEKQVALFDECMLDDDSKKCQELSEALAAMQEALKLGDGLGEDQDA